MKRANSGKKNGLFPSSYQQGTYQPPVHYAADQTKTVEDTTKIFHQTDETAGRVMDQMIAQRQQITGAHDKVWHMREKTEQAKRELQDLQYKYRQKKRRQANGQHA